MRVFSKSPVCEKTGIKNKPYVQICMSRGWGETLGEGFLWPSEREAQGQADRPNDRGQSSSSGLGKTRHEIQDDQIHMPLCAGRPARARMRAFKQQESGTLAQERKPRDQESREHSRPPAVASPPQRAGPQPWVSARSSP